MIRVLIVDDSPVVASLLEDILSSDPQITIVGKGRDGEEGVRLAMELRPDLITMDMHMPKMDGFEATKQIMAYAPTPILIVSASVMREGGGRNYMERAFTALSYGALDVMEKMLLEAGQPDETVVAEFIAKVKFLARIRVIPHPLAKLEHRQRHGPNAVPFPGGQKAGRKIVGIVASTGGPQSVLTILKALPSEMPAPILLVQHISPGFAEGMANWLDGQTPLRVKMGEHGESVAAGVVYIAPPERHMRVTASGTIALSDEPAVEGQRPSGNILLQSIAGAYGPHGIGVILTGMGRDGANGLKVLHDAKGRTLAQDEASCVVYGMPKAAVELGAADAAVPLGEIGAQLLRWCREP